MAAPVNATDLEGLFDPDRKPMFAGKSPTWWQQHGHQMAERFASTADQDCRGLVVCVLELQRDDFWRQHYASWDQLCEEVFGRPAEWVEQLVHGVRVLHQRGNRGAVRAEQALAAHGGDRRSEEARQARENQGDNVTLKRGNEAAYIRARLERDHPDVAAALERGEHRSARAAAITAGIIKPVPTVRLVDDPAKVAASIRRHLSQDQIAALVVELSSA
jgi:hypothetical protein